MEGIAEIWGSLSCQLRHADFGWLFRLHQFCMLYLCKRLTCRCTSNSATFSNIYLGTIWYGMPRTVQGNLFPHRNRELDQYIKVLCSIYKGFLRRRFLKQEMWYHTLRGMGSKGFLWRQCYGEVQIRQSIKQKRI